MARSSYKKFFLTYDDMYFYYNNIILENKRYPALCDREKSINNITSNTWFSIHSGKRYSTEFKSSEY